MDKLDKIDEAISKLKEEKKEMTPEELQKKEEDFALRFTYESIKMEGSSLSFQEVKDILASISSKKDKE
ncbi:MAG: hypothetical protein E6249_07345 [Peptoniphilus grossensis]|uniref:hypothetical protein n=1 Tax=Peptoniphilus grossensis TaxID=1465756 RepID=UPI00258F03B9|nr:hypothetical protein [Peptoniphilus grossensis]MDU5100270.1 hypothetical protein [Peptoniphilus grossensis]